MMRKVLREMTIVSEDGGFNNIEDIVEQKQKLKITSRGKVYFYGYDPRGKLRRKFRLKIDQSAAWRLFDIVDQSFAPFQTFPSVTDVGSWKLYISYNKKQADRYEGPLLNYDELGTISDLFRGILGRTDLLLFDGEAEIEQKKYRFVRPKMELFADVITTVEAKIKRKSVRIAAVEFNQNDEEYYYLCSDQSIKKGMLVWVPVGLRNQQAVARVVRVVFLDIKKLPIPLAEFRSVISKY